MPGTRERRTTSERALPPRSQTMLLSVLKAACPRAALLVIDGGENVVKDDASMPDTRPNSASNVALGRLLRELKNGLVGNEQAKETALKLGVVEGLLSVLDQSEATVSRSGSSCSESNHDVCLHVFGLLGILTRSACGTFSTLGGRIVPHVARTMASCSDTVDEGYSDDGSERLRSTALRCLNALCASIVLPTEPSFALSGLWGTSTLFGLAQRIVEDIAHGSWSPALRTLSVTTLAVITRDRELARMLGPSVASTGILLLRPVLAPRCATWNHYSSELFVEKCHGLSVRP